MPPMNPGVPQDHVILPLAGTRRTEAELMAIKHAKVDVVTIGAGLDRGDARRRSSARTGTTMVSLEQGDARAGRTRTSPTTTTASATRCATR